MISWHHPGSLVSCIDDKWETNEPDVIYPTLGQVLTIRDVDVYSIPGKEEVCFRFIEIVNKQRNYMHYANTEKMFFARHFRPIKKTSIESFQNILINLPKKILEAV